MSSDRLIYLPLGGAGEIGMNCYVYGYGPEDHERLIIVDLGVTFPDMDTTPGVDLILPDIAWLEARKERIEAIFITHAHEDHVGAVGHLWDRLGAPVYTRAFTGLHAARKLEEHGHDPDVIEVVQPWPERVDAGPFKVSFVPLSHSIPESSGLLIEAGDARVVHSGDFKIDETPVVGDPFDRALWRQVADGGVTALICDSTNVFTDHPGRSEASVGPAIEQLMAGASGLVCATTFASNIARLKTLAVAAHRSGRSVCLLGRAMRRMVEAGVQSGVLSDFPKTISPEDANQIPRENLMLLVTGSQGERRAASAQLATGKYLGLELKEGDTFLFSSKTIPGNERGVIRIVNRLSEKGVTVVDDASDKYHVSGHANRPDLKEMHAILHPGMLIPNHGEHRHLRAHVGLGAESDIPGVIATNGSMVTLSEGLPRIVDHVEAGRVYVDGSVQIGALDGVVRNRIRMALNGHVTVTLLIDEDGEPLGEPWCEPLGLPEVGTSNAPLAELIEHDLTQFLMRAGGKTLSDDDALERELRTIARRTAQSEIGKKPEVTIVVSRLS